MCGIVGAVAERNIVPILLEGLRRLEYRGYDSAGLAVTSEGAVLELRRAVGRVSDLQMRIGEAPVSGRTGIAHTRWATHGGVTEANAHPHVSNNRVAVIHNGIIENFQELKDRLLGLGYTFSSDTDTEVVAHLVHEHLKTGGSILDAVRASVAELRGAYALLVFDQADPERIIVSRVASPLVIGLGIGENFIASGVEALLPVTQKFIYLEQGDLAEITRETVQIFAADGSQADRPVHDAEFNAQAAEKGRFRHFMLKEIYDQPEALTSTLYGRVTGNEVVPASLGPKAMELLPRVRNIHIVACGTSYHAGAVGRYWLEGLAGIPCSVEIASEYRYRNVVVPEGTLFVTLSQSGETADTLEALRMAKDLGYLGTLTICNSGHSSMVRESDLVMLTQAGPEIGVASTKAFTTQLLSLLLVTLMLGRDRGISRERETAFVSELYKCVTAVEQALAMDTQIRELAEDFAEKHHTLFLGRGSMWPIAMEGALKLKEISYIHAEAYAAGELKHGPLALIDEDMPVVVVAPNNELLDKLKSNMQVVRARGGRLYVFADESLDIAAEDGLEIIPMPAVDRLTAPIVYTLPLQLLSYHVAVLRGTDVDQPRNLAKSVTVE